jgi:putative membrane protein
VTDVLAVLAQTPWYAQAGLALWLLTMISVPILGWAWGEAARTKGVATGVVLQAGVVVALLWETLRLVDLLWLIVLVLLVGWAAEFVGSHTGFPFGRYRYTERLQPQIGNVPILIPVAWLMMLPPAWAIADRITGGTRGWAFVGLSAVAFTAWDLFLDPQMVSWGLWTWESTSPHTASPSRRHAHRGYFGIPWSNFLGWLAVSAGITWIAAPFAAAEHLPVQPLVLVYALTWALETFGQLVFWRLPGPALVGCAGMGTFLVWALASA